MSRFQGAHDREHPVAKVRHRVRLPPPGEPGGHNLRGSNGPLCSHGHRPEGTFRTLPELVDQVPAHFHDLKAANELGPSHCGAYTFRFLAVHYPYVRYLEMIVRGLITTWTMCFHFSWGDSGTNGNACNPQRQDVYVDSGRGALVRNCPLTTLGPCQRVVRLLGHSTVLRPLC